MCVCVCARAARSHSRAPMATRTAHHRIRLSAPLTPPLSLFKPLSRSCTRWRSSAACSMRPQTPPIRVLRSVPLPSERLLCVMRKICARRLQLHVSGVIACRMLIFAFIRTGACCGVQGGGGFGQVPGHLGQQLVPVRAAPRRLLHALHHNQQVHLPRPAPAHSDAYVALAPPSPPCTCALGMRASIAISLPLALWDLLRSSLTCAHCTPCRQLHPWVPVPQARCRTLRSHQPHAGQCMGVRALLAAVRSLVHPSALRVH